jgi:2'-5' RNA ligase
MGNESAIIVPIPEVEPIVGPLRLKYDRAANLGVPAHITLLYPFFPAHAVADPIEALREVCATLDTIPFSFTEVRRFPAVAYLHPDKAETFAQITRTLVTRWPDYRPYGGVHAEIVPHLTVAEGVNVEILDAVEEALRGHLPIGCEARTVWLMTSDEAGVWSRAAGFRMGATD